MNRLCAFLVLLMVIVCPYQTCTAEEAQHGTLSFVVENDLFYNTDRHYTNGVRLVWVPGGDASPPGWAEKIARLVPWFPQEGKIRPGYAFGQSMFTPTDITVPDPPVTDRPYAGWLYGMIGLSVESGRQLDQLGLTLGIVGPSSLAEQSQKVVHRIIGANDPKGWDTQLHDEPGIVLTYQRSWRGLAARTFVGNEIDFTPHAGAALGNIFTYGNTGVTMRYGRHLPNDYGPPRIQPGLTGWGDFSPTARFGWYLFAGVEGRAIARNIFLDGNTFRTSRSVNKEPFVGDFQAGIVINWSNMRFSYTHVLRTKEFRTQHGNDAFGSFSVSVRF